MQNPLGSYRRAQRELRRNFEAFTRANCPTCPTPCCMRPARIAPTDILLAEATGWRSAVMSTPTHAEINVGEPSSGAPTAEGADMVTTVATRMLDALSSPPNSDNPSRKTNEVNEVNEVENAGEQAAKPVRGKAKRQNEDSDLAEAENAALPCEFLGTGGCTFPADLRPFGCTTYICKYMYARMDRATLTRIKRQVRELSDKHAILMRSAQHLHSAPSGSAANAFEEE